MMWGETRMKTQNSGRFGLGGRSSNLWESLDQELDIQEDLELTWSYCAYRNSVESAKISEEHPTTHRKIA